MDGVIRLDNQHQVGDVRLRITTGSTSTTLNVVTGNHARIDGGASVVDSFHVSSHEPRPDKGDEG